MKKLTYSILVALTALGSLSFLAKDPVPVQLVNTKWISPITDNCFESLCFTSAETVMFYRCEDNLYFEVGYKLEGHKIEIEAYGTSSMERASKLILIEDDGVLKQVSSQSNTFPKNYIKVAVSNCN